MSDSDDRVATWVMGILALIGFIVVGSFFSDCAGETYKGMNESPSVVTNQPITSISATEHWAKSDALKTNWTVSVCPAPRSKTTSESLSTCRR